MQRLGEVLAKARRLRALLGYQLRGSMFWTALALVAAALVLLLDGDIPPGSITLGVAIPATWLGEVWVKPWGGDAYARRVRTVIRMGSYEASNASRHRDARLREMRRVITELEPSQEYVGIHQQIIELMRESMRLEQSVDLSLADRAVRMRKIHGELSRLLESLTDCRFEPYVAQLTHLVDDYLRYAADTRRMTEGPIALRLERLKARKPPRQWREKHDRYVSAMGDYVTALRQYNMALEGDDISAIREAAAQIAVHHKEMGQRTERYLRDLGERYTGGRLEKSVKQSQENARQALEPCRVDNSQRRP